MPVFDIQPTLSNEHVKIRPLHEKDLEPLYSIASDPLIWEQHPNKDRYKREVFKNYFDGAIESKGAFLIFDTATDTAIGCTRFYDLNENEKSVFIGWTFLARDYWGTVYNRALKTLMLNHAFRFVDKVNFHIGAKNLRSQFAIQKLGAEKIKDMQMDDYGEIANLHFEYQIEKSKWIKMITIRRTNSSDKNFQELVKTLDLELKVRDGDEHLFYAQFNKIVAMKYVAVAYKDSVPVGCGALREYSRDTIEVKRMFVPETERGKGIATNILAELERWAKELGFKKCILETGEKQPEAIGLYKKNGYKLIPNYGQYANAYNSVCFEKEIKKTDTD